MCLKICLKCKHNCWDSYFSSLLECWVIFRFEVLSCIKWNLKAGDDNSLSLSLEWKICDLINDRTEAFQVSLLTKSWSKQTSLHYCKKKKHSFKWGEISVPACNFQALSNHYKRLNIITDKLCHTDLVRLFISIGNLTINWKYSPEISRNRFCAVEGLTEGIK